MPALITHPVFVAVTWLAGYFSFVVLAVERTVGELIPAAMQVQIKIIAYVTAASTAGATLVGVALFGVPCGLMLRWLGDPVPSRSLARSIGTAFWAITAQAWVLFAAVAVRPPPSLSLEDLASLASQGAQSGSGPDPVLGIGWAEEAQIVATAAFLLALFVLLSRSVARVNALIALAFGAAVVALAGTGMNWWRNALPI